ncbi:ABC transporter permease [Confluentibacter sediminis]|uniref:ABC transporter permease n=1 Tax=Confluentibacter sediminis TaxID=2219045 RepID=UPI000DAE72A1|nr:ABC transporter permease [Confluentibacter sediminis]
MLFKILREYLRRITRNYKIYAVSILGMSIAIIASFHIYHFVYKELSVDSFHTKRKEIYRVLSKWGNADYRISASPNPLGKLLKEKLPEVQDYVRIQKDEPPELHFKGNSELSKFIYADPSFFELFDFPMIAGSLKQFQDTPNGIVLTEKKAKTLFKNNNPIGEILSVSEYKNPDKRNLVVVGVVKDFPETSTIQAEGIINYSDYEKATGLGDGWGQWSPELYLYIPKLSNTKKLTDNISEELFEAHNSASNGNIQKLPFYLQRLDTIYFSSNDIRSEEKKGSLQFLKIISLVGILVLIFGGLNYIIMNIGRNSSRVKEFTTKRYLGASKGNILLQLISESILNILLALTIAFISFPWLNTYISGLIGFDYVLSLTSDAFMLVTFFGLALVIGLIIGFIEFLISYSAIILIINKNVKNTFNLSSKYIIGFQLVLSIATIISVLAIKKQVDYIQNKDVGFDTKNVISVATMNFIDEIKNLLQSKSYVNSFARGQNLFRTDSRASNTKLLELNKEIDAVVIQGDNNYLKTYKIELLQGKNLNPSLLSNNVNDHFDVGRIAKLRNSNSLVEVLVNENFVKKANLKNPIGSILTNDDATESSRKGIIVGVFKDVFNMPLYHSIQPIILGFDFNGYPNVFQISCKEGYKETLMTDLKKLFINKGIEDERVLNKVISSFDYEYIYKKELQLKRLLEAFTVIVLFISFLGLVAISLFITESKTKEIGIRKVNGATIKEIMLMLNKDFVKWAIIAFVIAVPVAYYAMSKWLENFAYKTNLSWWVFALAGMFTLVVALIAVSWQTYKAATRNPVESLRDE